MGKEELPCVHRSKAPVSKSRVREGVTPLKSKKVMKKKRRREGMVKADKSYNYHQRRRLKTFDVLKNMSLSNFTYM
jgi:hypothetical protein